MHWPVRVCHSAFLGLFMHPRIDSSGRRQLSVFLSHTCVNGEPGRNEPGTCTRAHQPPDAHRIKNLSTHTIPPCLNSKRPSPYAHVERGAAERDLHDVPGSVQALVDDAETLVHGQQGPAGDADDADQAASG